MSRAVRLRFWLCAVAAVALCAVFALRVAPHMPVEADILALLPADERDRAAEAAQTRYAEAIGQRILVLVGASDFDAARRGAAAYATVLRGSGLFDTVRDAIDTGERRALSGYLPYRDGLLSARHRALLDRGDRAALREQALNAFYSPAGLAQPYGLADDPLGLLSAFVAQTAATLGNARYTGGVMSIDAGGRHYVLVSAQLDRSALSLGLLDTATPMLRQARAAALGAGADEVLESGVVFHALAAAQRARQEIQTFGSLSLAGVLLLLLGSFRSPRPLLLSLGSLGLGIIAGLSACRLAFAQVHMATLIFGSSLIGISIDYALHFLGDRFRETTGWTPESTLRHAGPGILMGHLSTLLAFLALMAAPFPGLRQIALFSAAGLAAACASVLCLYPVLLRGWAPRHRPLALDLARRLAALHVPRIWRRGALLALLAVVAAGAWRLEFLDDIRVLQSSPAGLIAQEVRVRALLGRVPGSRFMLVSGDSEETLLQHEEALRARLGDGAAVAISSALPSIRQQRRDRERLAQAVYAEDGVLASVMATIGYAPAQIEAARAGFAARQAVLTPQTFLDSPLGEPYRALWLGHQDGRWFSAMPLLGDVPPAIEDGPHWRLIDKPRDISDMLGRYRRITLGLMAAVYLLIGLALALRYGWRGGLSVLLPAVGGAALALSALALAGIPLNLFNVLALLLVLGIGVDYAIFLREGRGGDTVLMAVLLSTLTTLLSFGLLAMSATAFIRAIGLTLALGISFVFLLAVIYRPVSSEELCQKS